MSEPTIVKDCPFPDFEYDDPRYLKNPFFLDKDEFEEFCIKTKNDLRHYLRVYQCYCILVIKYIKYSDNRDEMFRYIMEETRDQELADNLIKDYDEIHYDLTQLFKKITEKYLEEYTLSSYISNGIYRYYLLENELVDFCNKQKKITCDKDISNYKHINLERKIYILNYGDKTLLTPKQRNKYESKEKNLI